MEAMAAKASNVTVPVELKQLTRALAARQAPASRVVNEGWIVAGPPELVLCKVGPSWIGVGDHESRPYSLLVALFTEKAPL
jgi:hypothetical protein